MNKIQIIESEVVLEQLDEALKIQIDQPKTDFDVLNLKMTVKESTSLELHFKSLKDVKVDVSIHIDDNTSFTLSEIRESSKMKVQYQYELGSYSNVDVIKFYDCDELKELDLIQLNGEYASIHHQIKTIAKKPQRLDLVVYHNAGNTNSDVVNQGVSIEDGNIQLQVTGVVYQGIKGCSLNQNNRIITMNENKCNINPILLIEENDVVANHAAYIGKFNEEQIFYLMSRGIPEPQAFQLLIKGFLLDSVKDTEYTKKIIEKYWR